MGSKNKIVAIFAMYSVAYGNTSLKRFVDFVRSYDPSAKIVVVNNNPELVVSELSGLNLIIGSNSNGEFSAWQEGLEYISEKEKNESNLYFFGNDTFCVNRKMGLYEEASFRFSMKCVERSEFGAACGELSSFGESFCLMGPRIERWICTYLFALNRRALAGINWRINSDRDVLLTLLRDEGGEEDFFSERVDPNLRRHLIGWLFGRGDGPRWYKAAPLTSENIKFFTKKANAILSEKLLTSRLIGGNVKIHSVTGPIAMRICRKILHLLAPAQS